jgi:AcrR family transcriptional regulator
MSSVLSTGSTSATRRSLKARQLETVDRVVAATRQELREVRFEALTVRNVAVRAGVAPATAYTYFSSKNHLVAEVFWRLLSERPRLELAKAAPMERVIAVFDDLATFLADEPELAAATTAALLSTDPDVVALQVMVGTEINARLSEALGKPHSAAVLDALSLAWNGAMLQAGMGHTTFAQMGARLASTTRLIMGGKP